MFQNEIKRIFEEFDCLPYVSERRKEDLRQAMIHYYNVRNFSDAGFVREFHSEYGKAIFDPKVRKENKIFFDFIDFIYQNNLGVMQFMNLLDEKNLKKFKHELNEMKQVIFVSEFNKVFDDFWNTKIKEYDLKQKANKLIEG